MSTSQRLPRLRISRIVYLFGILLGFITQQWHAHWRADGTSTSFLDAAPSNILFFSWITLLVVLRMRDIGYSSLFGLVPASAGLSLLLPDPSNTGLTALVLVMRIVLLVWSAWIGITCLAFPSGWKSHGKSDRTGRVIMRVVESLFGLIILLAIAGSTYKLITRD